MTTKTAVKENIKEETVSVNPVVVAESENLAPEPVVFPEVEPLESVSEPAVSPEVEPLESVSEPTVTTELTRDEFADPSYLDPNARLPRILALRGPNPKLCGYFVSAEQLAKAGWFDFGAIADKFVSYTYESSGNEEEGLLLQSPRMLVCVRSGLLGYDRKASQEGEELVILGPWKREYKAIEEVSNLQVYEVMLLDEDNRALHALPFRYLAKGANGATFGQEWAKLCQEVTTCHAIANGIPAREKNDKFKALCVFHFHTARESVGTKQKGHACRVTGHEVPTLENWRNYFVGFQPELKTLAWETLQPELPKLLPGEGGLLALPASEERE